MVQVKNGIIVSTTKFWIFLILTFLIDSLDVNTIKKNYIRIRQLFNELIILNSETYYITDYYLMLYENHFNFLFKSEFVDNNLQYDKWYLYDYLMDIILKIIGNIVTILEALGIP